MKGARDDRARKSCRGGHVANCEGALTVGFGRDGSPRSSRGVAAVDTARELSDTAVASLEAGSGCSAEKVPRLAGGEVLEVRYLRQGTDRKEPRWAWF